MNWGEWCRPWEVALDYNWPAEDQSSEGGPSASRSQLTSVTETSGNETVDRGIVGLWKMFFQDRTGIESGFKQVPKNF